jgi:chorismate mutase/prephenate dehydratase
MKDDHDDLRTLRDGIDEVDAELTRLFERRMELARQVGEYKRERALPVTDPEREQEVLAERAARLRDERLAAPARVFFETLMRLSREEQRRVPSRETPGAAVAYQGVPGAFGHQAALQYIGERLRPDDCEDRREHGREGAAEAHGGESDGTLPCRTFEDVVKAVLSGEATCGVLPLENSSAGGISDVYDLLGAHGCAIVGEVMTPVAHCLLGVPGAKLSDIQMVYSHEQGFLQCRAYLTGHADWRQTPYFNTAISAQYVAEQGDPHNAAIASRLAAACYGLDVLAEDIHTQANNATRFVVVAIGPQEADTTANKATLAFSLRHERGTLHRALAAFVALGMNLTRIESRPIQGQSWEYRFYVDIEGRLTPEKLSVLVEALEADCVDCRLLGHYPATRRPHG